MPSISQYHATNGRGNRIPAHIVNSAGHRDYLPKNPAGETSRTTTKPVRIAVLPSGQQANEALINER